MERVTKKGILDLDFVVNSINKKTDFIGKKTDFIGEKTDFINKKLKTRIYAYVRLGGRQTFIGLKVKVSCFQSISFHENYLRTFI